MSEREMLLWIHITLKESIYRPRVGKYILYVCMCKCVPGGWVRGGGT